MSVLAYASIREHAREILRSLTLPQDDYRESRVIAHNLIMNALPFSKIANFVISVFEKEDPGNNEKKISVNSVVSKFATWYEKLRNVMEYREEEAILRAAIERILKRRLILGGSGKTTAEPLIRELVWARY